MPNEITAEELARKMCQMDGKNPDAAIPSIGNPGYAWMPYEDEAEAFLLAINAHAALMAERAKEAPERVRCWMAQDGVITEKQSDADFWRDVGIPFTPGWFTPNAKGSTDD